MIWGLRNIAVRIWLAVLLAVPAGFYLMPGIGRFLPFLSPIATGLLVFLLLYAAVGFFLDFLGRKRIRGLIREGEVWERAGIPARARQKYLGAVRMFDSFLLSPLSARKMAHDVTGTVARFSLTSDQGNGWFKPAVLSYLTRVAQDETLADIWLRRLDGGVGRAEQEVLTSLANAHYDNPRIMPLLGEICLNLGRRDYAAKRLYTHMLTDPDLERRFGEPIALILGDMGALEPAEQRGTVLSMERPLPEETEENRETGKNEEPRDRPAVPLKKQPWEIRKPLQQGIELTRLFFTRVNAAGRRAWSLTAAGLSFCILCAGRVISLVKERERLGFYVKTGVMVLICLWVGLFMWNTVSHLLTAKAVKEPALTVEKEIPKPFTIQVAAYLKQSHADRFLKVLAQKGVDARVIKTGGGGKTWYLIQVSEFPDKATAAAYGSKLKAEKIIDDFFVSNK